MKIKLNLAIEPDKPTLNNRLYTKPILQKAIKKYLRGTRNTGEIHPQEEAPRTKLGPVKEYSVEDIKDKGKKFVCEMEVFKDTYKDVFKYYKEIGKKYTNYFAAYPIGSGAVTRRKDGVKVVSEDYEIFSISIMPISAVPKETP